MKKTNFLKEHNAKIRAITFWVATTLIILAGLAFVLTVDTKIKFNSNKDTIFISAWLFFVIISSVGGGIFYFFGDSVKHKHILTLIMKGVGIALSAFYIFVLNAFEAKVLSMDVANATKTSVSTLCTVCLIVTIVSLVVFVVNYVFSIIFIEEDY